MPTEITPTTVRIEARDGTGQGVTQKRHFCARLTGCQGKRFRVASSGRSGWQSPHGLERHRLLWSLDANGDDWRAFDNLVIEDNDWVGWNEEAFADDVIYVTNLPSYTLMRTNAMLDQWVSDPLTSPTESAISGYEIGTLPALNNGLNGKDLPAVTCRAFKVGTGSKKVAVTNDIHSDEINNWVLEGLMDTLLSGAQIGQDLRSEYTFYIYPMMNPQGLYGGYCRVNPENNVDANRGWGGAPHDTALNELYTVAWATDLPGLVAELDLHSTPDRDPPSGSQRELWRRTDLSHETAVQPFIDALIPYGDLRLVSSSTSLATLTNWIRGEFTPPLTATMELAHGTDEFIPEWRQFGVDILAALLSISAEFQE